MPVSNTTCQSSAAVTKHLCECCHPPMFYHTASYTGDSSWLPNMRYSEIYNGVHTFPPKSHNRLWFRNLWCNTAAVELLHLGIIIFNPLPFISFSPTYDQWYVSRGAIYQIFFTVWEFSSSPAELLFNCSSGFGSFFLTAKTEGAIRASNNPFTW